MLDTAIFSAADYLYMRRALQLAANGRGHVSPNPMVGAVIEIGRASCRERV